MAQRFLTPSSRVHRRVALTSFDVMWAVLAPVLTFLLRDVPMFTVDGARPDVWGYCGLAFLVTTAVMACFRIGDALPRYFSLSDAVLAGKTALTSVAATALVMFTWTRLETLPRSVLILHCMVLAGGLVAARVTTRLHFTERERADRQRNRRGGPDRHNAILVGADRLGFLFLKIIEGNPSVRLNVVALLDPRPRMQGRTLAGYRVAGTPEMIGNLIDEYQVHGVELHRVIVATHRYLLPDGMLAVIREACDARGLTCELLTETMGLVGAEEHPLETGAEPAAPHFAGVAAGDSVSVAPAGWYWGLKRAIDIGAALSLGLALFPVALIVAMLVYFDVGAPVMFWQQRVGRHGGRFAVYKFRTFHAPYDRWGNPRLDRASPSRIGRLLRHSRLDELPQLYNILVGEMSLIGPRPLLPIDLPENDDTRLGVRPGLTGWAQVNGGKLLSVEEKNLLDVWYIANASLWLDIKIVARTVAMMVRGDRTDPSAIAQAWALAASRERGPGRPEVAANGGQAGLAAAAM